MGDLVEFLTARLDEDEWWAREASRLRKQEGQPVGDHWQWVNSDSDQVLVLDPSQYEYVGDEAGGAVAVSLRSREEYPTETVGDLPNFAISSAEEVPTSVAGHIARHDPARVLWEVEAKRRIIDALEQADPRTLPWAGLRIAVAMLALPFDSHPDYDESWRP